MTVQYNNYNDCTIQQLQWLTVQQLQWLYNLTITMTAQYNNYNYLQYQIIFRFAFHNEHLALLRLHPLYTPTKLPVTSKVTCCTSVAQRLTDWQIINRTRFSSKPEVFWIVWLRMRTAKSRNSAAGTVSMPRAGQPSNFGSIPLRNKRGSSFSKRRDRIRPTPSPE